MHEKKTSLAGGSLGLFVLLELLIELKPKNFNKNMIGVRQLLDGNLDGNRDIFTCYLVGK